MPKKLNGSFATGDKFDDAHHDVFNKAFWDPLHDV